MPDRRVSITFSPRSRHSAHATNAYDRHGLARSRNQQGSLCALVVVRKHLLGTGEAGAAFSTCVSKNFTNYLCALYAHVTPISRGPAHPMTQRRKATLITLISPEFRLIAGDLGLL